MADELAPPQEQQDAPRGAEDPRGMGEATLIDYWFDLSENAGTKTVVTYAYGFELDRRSSFTQSFTEIMAEVLPLIQTDLDTYGIAP